MSAHVDLKRSPIETLGQLVRWFQRPDKDRFTYWRTLFAGKRWALVLITSGKPGRPQDPAYQPARKTTEREIRVVRRHREVSGGAGEAQETSHEPGCDPRQTGCCSCAGEAQEGRDG